MSPDLYILVRNLVRSWFAFFISNYRFILDCSIGAKLGNVTVLVTLFLLLSFHDISLLELGCSSSLRWGRVKRIKLSGSYRTKDLSSILSSLEISRLPKKALYADSKGRKRVQP